MFKKLWIVLFLWLLNEKEECRLAEMGNRFCWFNGAMERLLFCLCLEEQESAKKDKKALRYLARDVCERGDGSASKKSLGLCHGISGNALSVLGFYRADKGSRSKWLEEAARMTLKALDDKSFEEWTMREGDAPFSLFNGIGGRALLLIEMHRELAQEQQKKEERTFGQEVAETFLRLMAFQ